jgi:hypothetical protein
MMTAIPIIVSLPIVITVVPIDRRGRYRVYLGVRLLVAGIRMPLPDATRDLIRLRADPDAIAIVVMRHAGAGRDALRGRLGAAAGLPVEECFDGRPRFRPYRPRPSEGAPPMRKIAWAYAGDHDVTARAAS